ncbi:MAG: DoxX family protein [Acidimicrobiales bacterium]|nr:DoxX family protein [Acidimicrobiales bacterium]RZV48004.1 MAG: DoxX family protein [Acidimicrobiales bacterium]
MEVLEWITAILLLVGIGMAGITKLTDQDMAVETADRLGYRNIMKPLGGAEVAGAIGVLIGAISSDLEWLGVLAALGIVGAMLGALVYHQRAGDTKEMAPPIVMAVVAVLYIVALFAN